MLGLNARQRSLHPEERLQGAMRRGKEKRGKGRSPHQAGMGSDPQRRTVLWRTYWTEEYPHPGGHKPQPPLRDRLARIKASSAVFQPNLRSSAEETKFAGPKRWSLARAPGTLGDAFALRLVLILCLGVADLGAHTRHPRSPLTSRGSQASFSLRLSPRFSLPAQQAPPPRLPGSPCPLTSYRPGTARCCPLTAGPGASFSRRRPAGSLGPATLPLGLGLPRPPHNCPGSPPAPRPRGHICLHLGSIPVSPQRRPEARTARKNSASPPHRPFPSPSQRQPGDPSRGA